MKRIRILVLLLVLFMAACGISWAQENIRVDGPQDLEEIMPQKESAGVPDLIIDSITFDPEPKEGNPVGIVRIHIRNAGTADSPENYMQVRCLVQECDQGKDCSDLSNSIKGIVRVPELEAGEAAEMEWVAPTLLKWVGGNYYIVAEIDSSNLVKESNETNNINKTMVFISSFRAESGAKK